MKRPASFIVVAANIILPICLFNNKKAQSFCFPGQQSSSLRYPRTSLTFSKEQVDVEVEIYDAGLCVSCFYFEDDRKHAVWLCVGNL